MPATFTVNDSYTFNLISAASSNEVGGGSFVSAGPINNGVETG